MLALGLLMVERAFRPIEPALCARVGVDSLDFASVMRGWAWWLAGLSACLAMFVVLVQLASALAGSQAVALAVTSWDWWAMLGCSGSSGLSSSGRAATPTRSARSKSRTW